jgi:hypothetical protein
VVLAIAIATPAGVGSLTIRLLTQHRGVKPMTIRTRLLTDTSSRVSSTRRRLSPGLIGRAGELASDAPIWAVEADEPALSLEMCSQAESGPGSHVGSQRAGLSQTTADDGEGMEA